MKMKDVLWLGVLLLIVSILVVPTSRELFIEWTTNYPYLMGFIKTALLATMGELLAHRIMSGRYSGQAGIVYKFIIWGFIGMSFVVVFKVFASGVIGAQEATLLPHVSRDLFSGKLLFAFLTSVMMNLIFAPTFMALHRFTDRFIELGKGKIKLIMKVKMDEVIDGINWRQFIQFVVLKTIPFFWIPAHTITFLLPETYRVIMAAFLSIALGIILSVAKRSHVVK